MNATSISRYPVPKLEDLPEDIRARMLKLQALRMRAKTELGRKFDQREFHDTVLNNGAMPLEILEEQVMFYIDAAKMR